MSIADELRELVRQRVAHPTCGPECEANRKAREMLHIIAIGQAKIAFERLNAEIDALLANCGPV